MPSRWSEQTYCNFDIPTYIPPEAFILEEGKFVKAFLLRVFLLDLKRMTENNTQDELFAHRVLEPTYDKEGRRNNTPEQLVDEMKTRYLKEIDAMLKEHKEFLAGTVSIKELVHSRMFSQHEMDTNAYGAILGARGRVHQQLERDFKCKIVLAGKGISNLLKDTSDLAQRLAELPPHCRIAATSEEMLGRCIARIDWILSDEPDAIAFREENRRHQANIEGRSHVRRSDAPGNGGSSGFKRGREEYGGPRTVLDDL